MRCRLNKSAIAGAAPAGKPYQLHDTEVQGFLLHVQPSGTAAYYFEYRNVQGRKLRYRIGRQSALDVDQAHKLAKIVAGKVAGGVDIQAVRKQERKDFAAERRRTLSVFLDEQYEPWARVHLKSAKPTMDRLRVDFGKWLGRPMSSFNRWFIEGWRKKELERGLSPVTTDRSVQRLQGALSKAVHWGLLDVHPFAGLKPLKTDRRGRVRFLSAEEELRLRAALDARETAMRAVRERYNRWRIARHKPPLPLRDGDIVDYISPVVLLALNTGLRHAELMGLNWCDIDLEARVLTVAGSKSKNGQTRQVPLNREATELMTRWKTQEGGERDEPVFKGPNGERLIRIDTAWRALRVAAKLGDYRMHDLRHHFASRLVQQGADLNTVRELLGHADITMVLRYAHLDPKNLAVAVERVAREPVNLVANG